MSKKFQRCEFCGRRFRPDRYNAHRQTCCGDPACVRERDRRRKREWSANKRATDEEFRRRENRRCAEANRHRRRNTSRQPERQPGVLLDEGMVSDVILGMIAQFTDAGYPSHVEAAVKSYASRGRRLAGLPSGGTDPPP